ncbi:hypothetical protein [Nocardiopsis sp. YSL2]|uniref:hypothetical protein n=1 Tax=Nocardiopsis sp. YSL2 TaxID=2939492 RepID=UPI0026F415CD|nr:hypothetical protein [Nocardiopsis sp. YSL2]
MTLIGAIIAALIGAIAAISVFVADILIRKHSDRRNLLLKIHEEMTEIENQRGRRILIKLLEENKHTRRLEEKDREMVNKSLSLIDIMGYYCRKGYIEESEVLTLWGASFQRILPKAEEFARQMDAEKGEVTWRYGRDLLNKANGMKFSAEIRKE